VAGQKVSKGYAFNDLGQAAGVSETPYGAIATLFSNATASSLGTLDPMDVAIATAINGSGQIVGYEPFSSDPNNTFHALSLLQRQHERHSFGGIQFRPRHL